MKPPLGIGRAGVAAGAIVSLIVSIGCACAQDRDSPHFPEIGPDSDWVSAVLSVADLVAVGEFAEPDDRFADNSTLLRNVETNVSFKVSAVYKGSVRPGSTVLIRLQSDMLVYPGKEVSRYVERERQLEELDERRSAATTRLSPQDIEDRLRPSRHIAATHGSTFYERGGAIRSATPYLILVSSIDGNTTYYGIDETRYEVLWGDLADDVRKELDARARRGQRETGR